MKKQLPKRSDLKLEETWDLTHLFKNEDEYEKAFLELEQEVSIFKKKYEFNLNNVDSIIEALGEYEELYKLLIWLSNYQNLSFSVEQTNETNNLRSASAQIRFQAINNMLTFFTNEIHNQSDELLKEVGNKHNEYSNYGSEIIENKKHRLSNDVEDALVNLSPILNSSYQHYGKFKFGDMKFSNFKVGNKTYPNSFTLFENEYEYETNTLIRRESYKSFYDTLSLYQNGIANIYITHVRKEKMLATLRGYNSVFDYLLENQKVPKAFMDRQIDLILDKLSGPMRKYAKLLKEIHNLDEMTFADLKLPIDPDFETKITPLEAKPLILDGLKVMGDEYLSIVKQAFDERWIDYPQNIGKSTGGFCASPYGNKSFILLNWNGQMDEVMVLAHELGHALHFQYANKYQNIYNTRPSLYFIEAPSTTSELLMSLALIKDAKTLREERYLKSVMISRTYYHNFVTHLLEAAFQREVYERVDNNEPLSATILNNIKLGVLQKFWKDDVVIPDYAKLTWMRQPHYYMGLYPYTYSAGLTIGTVVAKDILEGNLDPNKWIDVLKSGGTKTPLELTKMVNLDISGDNVLIDAINFISKQIDEIIALSKDL